MKKMRVHMENERSDPKGPIKTDWWNPKWIPITDNQCGDCACIDLSPAKGGKRGQVIDWWHEQGATGVLANTFRKWLAALVSELDRGTCKFESGAITRGK